MASGKVLLGCQVKSNTLFYPMGTFVMGQSATAAAEQYIVQQQTTTKKKTVHKDM